MVRGGITYIMTNRNNTTLYCGVTSDIVSRVMEHRSREYPRSFTARYNLFKMVYFKSFSFIAEAIEYEKFIKGKKRDWKNKLINYINPDWNDLWDEIKNW